MAAELMRAGEVAVLLGTSPWRVYELAREGKLPGVVRLGASVRFQRSAILALVGATAPVPAARGTVV